MATAVRSDGIDPVFELVGCAVPGGTRWALRDLDETTAVRWVAARRRPVVGPRCEAR